MAVVEVRERLTPRGGTIEGNFVRLYRRTFFVITDDAFDAAATIMNALPVSLGDAYQPQDLVGVHEFDLGSFANRITIECTAEDGLQWDAVVEYGPMDPSETPANPIDWPIRISWGNATYRTSTHKDAAGAAIRNSAGEFFNPPIEVDENRPVLRIVRNEATYDPALAADFSDTVNSGTFFGQPAKTWKCKPITAELEFNKDSGTTDGYYYVVTYEFEFNPDTWVTKVLQQGLRQKNLAGDIIPITEKGIPITSPVPLASDGFKLATGGTPVFLDVDVYPAVDFALLNIDPTGAPGQG